MSVVHHYQEIAPNVTAPAPGEKTAKQQEPVEQKSVRDIVTENLRDLFPVLKSVGRAKQPKDIGIYVGVAFMAVLML